MKSGIIQIGDHHSEGFTMNSLRVGSFLGTVTVSVLLCAVVSGIGILSPSFSYNQVVFAENQETPLIRDTYGVPSYNLKEREQPSSHSRLGNLRAPAIVSVRPISERPQKKNIAISKKKARKLMALLALVSLKEGGKSLSNN